MDMEDLLKRIKRLEYHQTLLIKMNQNSSQAFDKLIIEKSLGEEDVKEFHSLCEELNNEWEEQKAEGFVYFHPLLNKLTKKLHPELQAEETIEACITQGFFRPLMSELKKYL
jgi:hypothetical protein